MNDDVRSPGSGSTPGPLSAQPPPGLGDQDPGKFLTVLHFHSSINQLYRARCTDAAEQSTVQSYSLPPTGVHNHTQDDFKLKI
jgi:hypothetical protein